MVEGVIGELPQRDGCARLVERQDHQARWMARISRSKARRRQALDGGSIPGAVQPPAERAERDPLGHECTGGARALVTEGVSFGTLRRRLDGTWDARSGERRVGEER